MYSYFAFICSTKSENVLKINKEKKKYFEEDQNIL